MAHKEKRENGVIEYASISSERLFDFLWENKFMNKIQRIFESRRIFIEENTFIFKNLRIDFRGVLSRRIIHLQRPI